MDAITGPLADIPPVYLTIGAALLALMLLRRVPVIGPLVNIAMWIVIAAGIYLALDRRAGLDPYLEPIAGLFRGDREEVVGDEMRIAMSTDGHFWVRARFGGIERRMLVDSGATVTALSTDTAEAAGLTIGGDPFPVLLRTANGTVKAETSVVDEMRLGNIVARDLKVVVSPSFGGTNVIGMNFLSRLKSWRVEGRTLILTPHNPQPVG